MKVIFLLIVVQFLYAGSDLKQNYKAEFSKLFKPIENKVLDTGAFYSYSKTKAELESIKPLAKKSGLSSSELCKWYSLYTLVLSKKLDKSSLELINAGNEYIDIFKNKSCMSKEKLARIDYRLSNAYKYRGNFTKSIEHLKRFIDLAKQINMVPESTILAQKEELAYLLEENKESAKALKINLSVEAEAKKIGIPQKLFLNLYNNIAQNYYNLKEFKKTTEYLDKRLDIAKKYHNFEAEQNTLFQKAVLAFEQKEFKKSEKLFKLRLKLAKKRENELKTTTIKDIEQDLKTYYKKMHKVKTEGKTETIYLKNTLLNRGKDTIISFDLCNRDEKKVYIEKRFIPGFYFTIWGVRIEQNDKELPFLGATVKLKPA